MNTDQLVGSTWNSMGLQPLAKESEAQTVMPQRVCETAARVHGKIRLYLSVEPPQQLAYSCLE